MKTRILLLLALLLVVSPAWAQPAFPTVQAVNGGTQGTSTTSHPVNLPAGIQNSNLLFAVITVTGLPSSGLATQITWPTGWTELYERIYDDSIDVGTQSLAFRRADGTEGGSITVTTDDSVFSSHTSYRLTGHHATSDPEAGGAAAGNLDPDPPSLSPSWGAEDTLWFALCGFSLNDDDITISSAPTNYTNLREDNGGAIGEQTSTGTARRELNSASENPGLFAGATGRRWVANTIAIRPAAAVTATPRRRVVVY